MRSPLSTAATPADHSSWRCGGHSALYGGLWLPSGFLVTSIGRRLPAAADSPGQLRSGHAHSREASSAPPAHTAPQTRNGAGTPTVKATAAVIAADSQPDTHHGQLTRSASQYGDQRARRTYRFTSPSMSVIVPRA